MVIKLDFEIKGVFDENDKYKEDYKDDEYDLWQQLVNKIEKNKELYNKMGVIAGIGRFKDGKYYYYVSYENNTEIEERKAINNEGHYIGPLYDILYIIVDDFDELLEVLKEQEGYIDDNSLAEIAYDKDIVTYLLTKNI